MTGPQIIVLATPVFLLLIVIEFLVGWRRGRNTYRLSDALNSIGIGILSQVVGLFTKLLAIGLYTVVFEHAAMLKWRVDSPWSWIVGLLVYDFCYYWLHRFGHRVALGWAAHAVHHQSEDYNLSTALRQTGSGWIASWAFYLPMALLGIPPLVFAVVALVDLLYQYWVHTEQIGRLGWFDRWFCAPSNHRVHHAVNDGYVDRNYGGILLVWDRLFGTWCEERDDQPCVYGTRTPLRSWNPLWANVQVYAGLWREMRLCTRWRDRLALWVKPPGWRPADVIARHGACTFDIAAVQRFDPPLSRRRQVVALALFGALLAATAWLLWNAHRLTGPVLVVDSGALIAGLWMVGAVCTAPNSSAKSIQHGSTTWQQNG